MYNVIVIVFKNFSYSLPKIFIFISLNIHLVKFVMLQKEFLYDIIKSRLQSDFGGEKNYEFKYEK
ncbi:hypothetical protein BEN51_04855 [Clostridium isatidis]|uniref:Uncharacterized protein n=1 Tax=Clostridium isatidis TaxID=182773 RepID=A0A343JBB4_9CLOT|nr:hypothetical protein BEN51_04855 [Clostridium isatidis]